MKSTELYVILPVHNRSDVTSTCVKCLSVQSYQNWKLILVDAASADNTVEEVRKLVPSVFVVEGEANWWWARSLHEGVLRAKELGARSEDFILFLNDDQIFSSTFLESAVELLSEQPKTLLLPECFSQETGGRLAHECGIHFNESDFDFKSTKISDQITCLSTRALFLRFEDYFQIGPLKYEWLPHYHSDYEFTHRAYKKGYRLVCSDKIQIKVREDLTGKRSLKGFPSFWSKLQYAFSEKYPGNPIRMSLFALLMQKQSQAVVTITKIWTRPLLKKLIKDF